MYEVVDHYADRGVLCAVRGDRAIDTVTEDAAPRGRSQPAACALTWPSGSGA